MDYRRARAKKPTDRQQKAAEGLKAGKSIKQAMLEAGYSHTTASMGMRAVPLTVQALGIKGSAVYQAGRGCSIEDLKYLAIGRLVLNVTEGKDGGVMSAKTLGSHKDLALWTAENQVGVVLVNAPAVVAQQLVVPEDTPSK